LVVAVNALGWVDPIVTESIPPGYTPRFRYTDEPTIRFRQLAGALVVLGVVFIGLLGSVRNASLLKGTRNRFDSLNQPMWCPVK
jgi:hypothetical protein